MEDKIVYFDTSADELLRIIVVGTLAYFTIIFLLRTSGKRTLSSMTAFDFVVTVAIGSAFGRILTASNVSYTEAFVTFTLLITLQFLISKLSTKSKAFKKFLTSEPKLLFYKGIFIEKNLKRERLRKDDLLSAVRASNMASMDEVEAIIFETSGSLSVVEKSSSKDNSSYEEALSNENLKER